MKYTIYKDGSVKIRLTAAEVPFMEWVLSEGLAGAAFEDNDEAKGTLNPDAYKSWLHMGRPHWMGSIRRLTMEDKR
jgi:hypothetical protein